LSKSRKFPGGVAGPPGFCINDKSKHIPVYHGMYHHVAVIARFKTIDPMFELIGIFGNWMPSMASIANQFFEKEP
jgi:hypothetical protein